MTRQTQTRRRDERARQRGVALLAASVAITVTALIVTEFSTNTQVDYIAAANARDNMRAHFLARSAVNLGQLVIRVQTDVIDRYRKSLGLGDLQLADYVGLFMGAFGGNQEEVDSLAQMMGGMAGDELKGLGLDEGMFDVQITTEDGKINLNCANGQQQTRDNLKTKLGALFYFNAFNPIFENEDADGWRRDRDQQVAAMIDYIDTDQAKFDARGSAEDYGYQNLPDKYNEKNNYLDSVGELKLIRGVDERFWTLFGSQFTVYGGCRENVGALQDPKLIAALIFLAAKDQQDDPVINDPSGQKLWLLARRVAEARGFGVYFDDLNAFAEFVKSPDGALQDLLAGSGATAGTGGDLPAGYVPVEGVELDMAKLNQIAYAGPRRTYRVEATASIGEFQKRIVAIWDTQPQTQNSRNPGYERGAWVFWRED